MINDQIMIESVMTSDSRYIDTWKVEITEPLYFDDPRRPQMRWITDRLQGNIFGILGQPWLFLRGGDNIQVIGKLITVDDVPKAVRLEDEDIPLIRLLFDYPIDRSRVTDVAASGTILLLAEE